MPYAILSVSDKTGIGDLAKQLNDRGWTLLSTGGTAQAIREAAVPVKGISDHTGFPEILGGRVKTLHPAVHAGLLARLSVETDVRDLERNEIDPVGLVVVNLYPFRETVARPDTTLAGALEQIDIGGPTMLRAAAKNHPFVWPICDPDDYPALIEALDAGEGADQDEFRRFLAAKVFAHTAAYDSAVAGYLRGSKEEAEDTAELPSDLMVSVTRVQSLRYGENPDQPAAFYRTSSSPPVGIPGLRQLHGKALSYNNILDLDGALIAIAPFLGGEDSACAILKHTTPCGIAVGRSPADAYRKALACDPVSAFGSTVVFSEPVTEAVAEEISQLFVECLVAPGYAASALQILQQKKNIRILEPGEEGRIAAGGGHLAAGLELRGVAGGVLVQGSPAPARPSEFRTGTTIATSREPSDEEWTDLAFAWAAVQSVKSNAILLARDGAAVGIGAGQMSRVDAAHLAAHKATNAGFQLEGLVLASDAFFPFRDGVDAAAEAGVTAIVQPGGSVRDSEAIQAADEHGIAMVFTGRRTFRH